MSNTSKLLDQVRSQLAPSEEALGEARRRRDITKDAALGFSGAARVFNSGSLAHATANCPVHHRDQGLDADCGVVLDRRRFPSLGPDGSGEGPNAIVDDIADEVLGKVRAEYSAAVVTVTKRAILVSCNQPLSTGEDPTVDLVVGLDRRSADGLWIPNTEQHRWDPSDPEEHTRLLTAEPKALRVTRARAIRLAKAENKRDAEVPLCSFNLEAIGLMFVGPGQDVAAALLALWENGADDLRKRLTPDPAHVSPPIKVADRDFAIDRLEAAARSLRTALEHDYDISVVRAELRRLWPEFVASTDGGLSKAQILAEMKTGSSLHVTAVGGLSATAGVPLKNTRSYGTVLN